MASFTAVNDTLELFVPAKGETIAVAISGTYNQVIELQRELGSRGSGAWAPIQTFNTEDATEAFEYVTIRSDENVRLFLRTDAGGTATVTLTDISDLDGPVVRDREGNALVTYRQAGPVFHGGMQRDSNSIVTLAASTLTLTAPLHAGRIVVTAQAATLTVTLPEAVGSGNVYTLFTSITATGDHIYKVASAGDSFGGGVSISTDIAGVTELCVAADDTITMNGGTKGGLIGSWVRFTDVTAALWMVDGFLASTSTEASTFSATV